MEYIAKIEKGSIALKVWTEEVVFFKSIKTYSSGFRLLNLSRSGTRFLREFPEDGDPSIAAALDMLESIRKEAGDNALLKELLNTMEEKVKEVSHERKNHGR